MKACEIAWNAGSRSSRAASAARVGMAEAAAEPVLARPAHAVGLEDAEGAGDLQPAAGVPDIGHLLVQPLLVEQADRLVGRAHGQRRHLQRPAPVRLGAREHRPVGRHQAVEMVEDAVALDQRLTIVQHQRRHPGQRVVRADLLRIAEHRPRPLLEGQAVQRQGDADAADEGRIILADQDHGAALRTGRSRRAPRTKPLPGPRIGRERRRCSAPNRLIPRATGFDPIEPPV